MKMTPCTPPEKPARKYGKIMCIIEEFLEMNVPIVLLEDVPNNYVSANGFYNSLKECVKRCKYPVKVFMRQGKLYLCRKTSEIP